MSNLMKQLQLRNTPTKSGFDCTRGIKFTAKTGQATPAGPVKYVYPGCSHNFGIQSFTRTDAINSAAYARLREYYDFYFVPFEVLWNKWDSVITQMKDNCQHAMGPVYDDNLPLSLDLPYFTCYSVYYYIHSLVGAAYSKYDSDAFGFKRSANTVRLLSYLGYPDFSPYLDPTFTWEKYPMPNKRLSPFPLLAYQKVYADHIRYQQWEKSNPSTFNLDYFTGSGSGEIDFISEPVFTKFIKEYNFFDMRYFNYNKDMFFGLLPNTQFGDSSLVTASSAYSDNVALSLHNFKLQAYEYGGSPEAPGSTLRLATDGSSEKTYVYAHDGTSYHDAFFSITNAAQVGVNGINSTFSILALRQAEALQRWKEVSQSVDQDYKSQVEAHFGVKVSEYLAHKSTWLNGYYNSLDINPIVNTNLEGDNVANIKGVGTMNTNGTFTFNSQDRYGIVLCLYHVAPIFDYACGYTDPTVYVSHPTDFPIPEFDRIGMEPVYFQDLCMTPYSVESSTDVPGFPTWLTLGVKQDKILGYAPRYVKWKTSVDIALGAFAKNEKSWVLPLDYQGLENQLRTFNSGQQDIDYVFTSDTFRINPHIVDTIFAAKADNTYDTDHYKINCQYIDTNTQPLDYNGLPM